MNSARRKVLQRPNTGGLRREFLCFGSRLVGFRKMVGAAKIGDHLAQGKAGGQPTQDERVVQTPCRNACIFISQRHTERPLAAAYAARRDYRVLADASGKVESGCGYRWLWCAAIRRGALYLLTMKPRIRAGRLARTEGVLCSSRLDRPVASGKVSERLDVHTIENCQTGGFIGSCPSWFFFRRSRSRIMASYSRFCSSFSTCRIAERISCRISSNWGLTAKCN